MPRRRARLAKANEKWYFLSKKNGKKSGFLAF
jgi:hypothetical protein